MHWHQWGWNSGLHGPCAHCKRAITTKPSCPLCEPKTKISYLDYETDVDFQAIGIRGHVCLVSKNLTGLQDSTGSVGKEEDKIK